MILLVPGVVAAHPDVPDASLSAQQVLDYVAYKQSALIIGNGLSFIFATFLWFLGVLARGLLFVALEMAEASVEIVHPATTARFENFEQYAQLIFISQALSGWLYSFPWVGLAVMLGATSLTALKTEFLPKWLAWAGFLAALVAILKFLVPRATVALLWIVAVSVLMIIGSVTSSSRGARRLGGGL